jgi:predicted alpha/beta hydrolase family esterase
MTQENIPVPVENIRGYSKEVWLIHGANASPASFNYIKDKLEEDPNFNDFMFTEVSYNCQEHIPSIVKALAASAPKDKQLYIIGHSLGGVIAAAISQRIKHFEMNASLRGVITLASPFGGSESADYLKWLYPNYHLFKSISTQNRMIVDLQSAGAVVPTLSLITSSGNNPLISKANDGVVTVSSQRSLPGSRYVEVPFNHFEVMVVPETVDHIKSFLTNQ